MHVLEDVGLVVVHQQVREKRYTPHPERLSALERWICDLGAKWDARLLRLNEFAESQPDA